MHTLKPTDIREIPPDDPSEIGIIVGQIIEMIDQRTLGGHGGFPGVNSLLLKDVLGQEKIVNAAILKFITELVADMIHGDSFDLRQKYHILVDICAVNKPGELFLALYQLLGAIRRLTTRAEDKREKGPIILEIAVSSARQVFGKMLPTAIEQQLLLPLGHSSEYGNRQAVLAILTAIRARLIDSVRLSPGKEAHMQEIERLTTAVKAWYEKHMPSKPPPNTALQK